MSGILYFVHSFSLSVFEAIQVPDEYDSDKSNDDDDEVEDGRCYVHHWQISMVTMMTVVKVEVQAMMKMDICR